MTRLFLAALAAFSFAAHAQDHPRLYFDASDLPQLRADTAGARAHIWQNLRGYAEDELGNPPPASSDPGNGLNFFRLGGDKLAAFALVAAITEEERFIQHAKDYMLAYASWEYWGEEEMRDLGHGHMLFGNAVAYDWLYPHLSETERTLLRDTLASWTRKMYEASAAEERNETWNNWWRHSYAQNHTSTTNGTMGVAALALKGEAAGADAWIAQAAEKIGRIAYMLEGIGDGSWHEGGGYQGYMTSYSAQFMYNYRRVEGVDIFPHDYYRAFVRYRAFNYLPQSYHRILAFGNFHWDWYDERNMLALTFAANEYDDPTAQWLVERYYDHVTRYCNQYSAFSQTLQFLYHAPAAAAPDDFPFGATFDDLQAAIWRESWEDDALVFGFKSGAYGGTFVADAVMNDAYPFEHPDANLNAGHDHDDMQGFYLHRNGEWLAPECVTYGDTDARYHNVVLIDGEGHYRPITDYDAFIDTMAESRAYLNASGSLGRRAFLSSDGTNRFRNIGDVAKWTRDVLYLRPATLVVVDDIESGSSHALEWICHLNADATNTLDGSWAKSATPEGQAFGVFTAVPSGASTSLGVTLHPEAGYPDQPRVSVSTTGSDVRYAHALHATTNAEWNAKPTITTLADVDAGLALRILRGDVKTDAIVPDLPDTTGITIGDYALDGEAATVSRDGADNVVGYFLAEGTTLSQTSATTTFVRADAAPIWIDVELAGTAAIVAYDGGAAPVTIHAPDATTLTVNGETTPFSRDVDAIVFNAPNDAPDHSTLPERPELKPAYPNPFNPKTTVAFSLPRAGEIELAAFNALGERVATLTAGYKTAGDHEATFDASDLPSGVYLIRLCAASFSAAQKVILIK